MRSAAAAAAPLSDTGHRVAPRSWSQVSSFLRGTSKLLVEPDVQNYGIRCSRMYLRLPAEIRQRN